MCPPRTAKAIFGCAWSLVSLIHLKTDRNLLSDREPSGSQMCHTCTETPLCLSVSTWATGIWFLDFLIPGGRIPEVGGAISAGRVPKCSRHVSWWKHICRRKRAWIWFLARWLHCSHDHPCLGWCRVLWKTVQVLWKRADTNPCPVSHRRCSTTPPHRKATLLTPRFCHHNPQSAV